MKKSSSRFVPALVVRLTRLGCFACGWVLASMAGLVSAALAADAGARPNVIVFLSDDQGWGDLSINGNTNVATPHIDSIGRAGAIVDRFYVSPVCSPTRAEFLTGRYHPRGGVRGTSVGEERLNLDERTIAEAFKAAGYATGVFGKWHNGSQWPYHPNARGFDEFYGFTSGHWAEYFDALLERNGEPVRGKGYIADDFTDRALEFIGKNRSRPFFCYVPYNTPHSPFDVPPEDWARWKDRPITLRAAAGENEDLAVTRSVLAMGENIDRNVGRVLRRLDELQLADNTIVIYFCDNGPNGVRWNGGMKGRKGSTSEGGVRSPFLIRWPGRIKPATTIPQIAGAIDLLPTLTKLAGIPVLGSKPLDGRDISPLLLGHVASWPDRRIFSHNNGARGTAVSVRTQQYRLDASGELYDLQRDPGQTQDIAGERPEIAAELRAAVQQWRIEVLGDTGAAAPRGSREPRDDRPFTVGYREFPRSRLPARDGVPHGSVGRSSPSPNSSYFTRWHARDGYITWDIEVATTGEYDVELLYACPATDVGSTIELEFKGAKVTGKVGPAWDPPFYAPYTIPRPAPELLPKEFRPLRLAPLRLEKGRGLLTLRALEIPGASVMELRQLTLTLR